MSRNVIDYCPYGDGCAMLCSASWSAIVTDLPTLLTVAEASQHLRVSRWSTYRLIQSRRLRTITIGRRRFVPTDALAEYINRGSEIDQ